MTNSLRLLLVSTCAILSLAWCASHEPAPVFFPDKLAVSSGGFFGDSFSVITEGNQLVYRRFSSKPFRSQTVRFSPSDQQWQAFWSEMDAVFLWKWKAHYKPFGIVQDGTQWSLSIECKGRKITSNGDNAYPSDLSPFITSANPSKRYARFLFAIRALIGKRAFY